MTLPALALIIRSSTMEKNVRVREEANLKLIDKIIIKLPDEIPFLDLSFWIHHNRDVTGKNVTK